MCFFCLDGAATTAVCCIATLAADGIAGDIAATPLPQVFTVHIHGARCVDGTDSQTRIPGPLPASIDIAEGIDDIHGVVSAAEAGLEPGQRILSLLKELSSLSGHAVVVALERADRLMLLALLGEELLQLLGPQCLSLIHI